MLALLKAEPFKLMGMINIGSLFSMGLPNLVLSQLNATLRVYISYTLGLHYRWNSLCQFTFCNTGKKYQWFPVS